MKRLLLASLALLLAAAPTTLPAATAQASAPTLSTQQTNELITSYAHLTTEYYKKVDKQAVFDGVRNNIVAYLRANGVANPTLPALRASDDDVSNARELERAVSGAVATYAVKAGGKSGVKVGATNITYAAISGALGSVKDKYTVFLSPKEYADINQSLDAPSFGGVGLTYDIDDKTKDIHVQNVIPDGPAEKAGLLNEDLITQINGQSVPALVNGKVAEAQTKIIQGMLRGEPGTKVNLTVDRAGTMETYMVTRASIRPPSVLSKLLPNEIGWVQLSVFGADTGRELDAALHRLDAQGAKAFILDLRSNGGGYLNAAVDVSSKFISTGPIVTVESRAGTDTEYDAENTAISPRPLAVLVNHYTASASEITAGAIQDSGVGEIIGTRTYGKGVVQSIFPLGDGAAVKITTARYLTPHGRDINSIGIQPEILSDLPKDTRIKAGDPATDIQLGAAITYLQSRIAARTSASTQ
jgi:carboxyl-terminal processing protease